MYLNKSNKGIGWYSVINKDGKGNKLDKGEYINFVFKRGTEPDENVLVADLYLIDQYGNKRPVYAYVDEYNGNRSVKFRILEPLAQSQQVKEDNSKMGGSRSDLGQSVDIDPSELPFY